MPKCQSCNYNLKVFKNVGWQHFNIMGVQESVGEVVEEFAYWWIKIHCFSYNLGCWLACHFILHIGRSLRPIGMHRELF